MGPSKAVNSVDLTLGRQATLGIVGESGCGKSITAMSVMQLIKSPPGRIVQGGIPFRPDESRPPTTSHRERAGGSAGRGVRDMHGGGQVGNLQEP